MTNMYNLKLIEIKSNRIDGKFQDFVLISEHVSRIEILEILEKATWKVRREQLAKEEHDKKLDMDLSILQSRYRGLYLVICRQWKGL